MKGERMSRDDVKGLVTKYIEDVWNNADLVALNELTGPEYTYHFGSHPPRDKVAMQQLLHELHTAFPDWRVQIQDIIAEGTTVAVRWSGTVTHGGVFYGISPTGKQIIVAGINIYLIEGRKILREWEQMNSLAILLQMGVLPPTKR
jgi:predicted ester cyclase